MSVMFGTISSYHSQDPFGENPPSWIWVCGYSALKNQVYFYAKLNYLGCIINKNINFKNLGSLIEISLRRDVENIKMSEMWFQMHL